MIFPSIYYSPLFLSPGFFLNVEISLLLFDFGWVLKGVRRRAGAPSGPAGTLRGFDMAVSGSFVFPTLLCLFKKKKKFWGFFFFGGKNYNFHFLAAGRFETFESRL